MESAILLRIPLILIEEFINTHIKLCILSDVLGNANLFDQLNRIKKLTTNIVITFTKKAKAVSSANHLGCYPVNYGVLSVTTIKCGNKSCDLYETNDKNELVVIKNFYNRMDHGLAVFLYDGNILFTILYEYFERIVIKKWRPYNKSLCIENSLSSINDLKNKIFKKFRKNGNLKEIITQKENMTFEMTTWDHLGNETIRKFKEPYEIPIPKFKKNGIIKIKVFRNPFKE